MDPQFTFVEEMESALHMSRHGHEDQFIETKLKEKSVPPEVITELMAMIQKDKHLTRIRKGRQLLFGGVATLGLGFILTIVFAHSGTSISFALYGLTSIGAVLLIAGLAKIFH